MNPNLLPDKVYFRPDETDHGGKVESDIALKIREIVRSIGDDSTELPHSRFSMWDNNCVLVPSIPDPEDSERDLGGMIAMRADRSEIASSIDDFDGEHDFDDITIVILHHGYWDEAESCQECGLAESLLQGMGPSWLTRSPT